jgi:hypothetical protein
LLQNCVRFLNLVELRVFFFQVFNQSLNILEPGIHCL